MEKKGNRESRFAIKLMLRRRVFLVVKAKLGDLDRDQPGEMLEIPGVAKWSTFFLTYILLAGKQV